MSRTYKHTIIGKFNNGLIDVDDVDINIIKYWNRVNFTIGKARKNRIVKYAKLITE